MKPFVNTVIFFAAIAYSSLVNATVELPSFGCTDQDGFHNCSLPNLSRPIQFRLSGQEPDTAAEYVKDLKANKKLFILYTQDEIDNAHIQTTQAISGLVTQVKQLRTDLDDAKSSFSTKLGEEAKKAIKENLASTIGFLIREDAEFRELLKALIKEK